MWLLVFFSCLFSFFLSIVAARQQCVSRGFDSTPFLLLVSVIVAEVMEELQELQERVAQLRADNKRLRQARLPSSCDAPPIEPGPSVTTSQSSNEHALPEISVFVPQDRKCQTFSGRAGLNIDDWVELVMQLVCRPAIRLFLTKLSLTI